VRGERGSIVLSTIFTPAAKAPAQRTQYETGNNKQCKKRFADFLTGVDELVRLGLMHYCTST